MEAAHLPATVDWNPEAYSSLQVSLEALHASPDLIFRFWAELTTVFADLDLLTSTRSIALQPFRFVRFSLRDEKGSIWNFELGLRFYHTGKAVGIANVSVDRVDEPDTHSTTCRHKT